MSSISLSSLHVEAGSIAGDVASSSGDTTANEDETPGIESQKDSAVTPLKKASEDNLLSDNATSETPDQSVERSAAALEQKKEHDDAQNEKKAPSILSEDSLDSQQPPQEAVDRAEEELNKYSLEEPATTAVISPSAEDTGLPPSISLTQLKGNDKETEAPAAASIPDQMASPPPPSSRKSPIRTSSSAFSPADRLKRSSTANSIASHPESDVADTNLDAFDEQDDSGKGRMVADSMAPRPARRPSFEPPTTPSRSKANTPTTGKTSPIDDLLAQEQDFLPIDAVDDVDGADEDGMPLVKCSDCGAKVSLVKLADHVCGPSSSSKVAFPSSSSAGDFGSTSPFRDRRETGPEDVPKGALSPETVDSPQMSHRSVTSSRPDVPDDESLASISASMEDTHLQGSLDPSGTNFPTVTC